MADRIIAQADLSGIRNCLRELGEYIDTTNSNVITVGKNVDALQQDLDALTADFHDFVQAHRLSARAQLAETRLVKLRQELEQLRSAAPASAVRHWRHYCSSDSSAD